LTSKGPKLSSNFPVTVILAGGLATRLGHLTQTKPKAMVEVAGEPFVAHQLRLLARERVKRVVMCLGYLSDQIQQFVESGSKYNLEVTYSCDGPTSLGTGGAIKKALPLLDEHFGIIYGDSYLDISFDPVYRAFLRCGKPALMTVLLNRNQWDKSNILFKDGVIELYDKDSQSEDLHHIDYGLSILSKSVFEDYPFDVPFDLASVFKNLVSKREMGGFEVHNRFYEIGTWQGLSDMETYLRESCKQ
jgi:MurNAc alpha-1-phosphate uridylyltransferase